MVSYGVLWSPAKKIDDLREIYAAELKEEADSFQAPLKGFNMFLTSF